MPCNLPPTPLCIRRGSTVALPLRLHSDRWRWITITGVSNSAPVQITAPGHQIPHQWLGAIYNVVGPSELNASRDVAKIRPADMVRFDVVDGDTLAINTINSAAMPAYVSGGQIAVPEPLDLSLYVSARMQVNAPDGTQLAFFSTADGTLDIDIASRAIWLRLTPAQSAAITWDSGLYDIELVTASGDVKNPVSPDSTITVIREQTTDHP